MPNEATNDIYRYIARAAYGDDDVLINSDAEVNVVAHEGAWVQAWVFVHDEEAV